MAFHVSTDVGLVPVRSTSTEPQLQSDSQESTRNESKPFRFLDLPPELRNEIYKIHLEEEGVITISRRRVSLTTPTFGVNLLRCCRQIYKETAPYVKAEWLTMKLKTPIDNWQSYNTLKVVFDDSPLFPNASNRMLAHVVALRLDSPVTARVDFWFITPPPALSLQNMKRLEHVDTYLRLQGCSRDPHKRQELKA